MILYKQYGRRFSWQRAVVYALLILVMFIIFVPLVVIASSSFKNEMEIFSYPMTIIPVKPTIDNFVKLLAGFPLYTFNSLKLTTIIVLVQLFTATTGGYAFAKLKWRGKESLFLLYISSIMVPIQTYIIPQFTVIRTLMMYNTHMSLIMIASFSAFGIFLMRQFFMTIPETLLDAARIDGASEYFIFARLMIPLSRAAIATLIVFSFRWFWNDFFLPLIYLTSEHLKTIPLGMADFTTEYFTYHGPQMAASLISIIPVLIVFLLAQKHVMESVVTTGIKG